MKCREKISSCWFTRRYTHSRAGHGKGRSLEHHPTVTHRWQTQELEESSVASWGAHQQEAASEVEPGFRPSLHLPFCRILNIFLRRMGISVFPLFPVNSPGSRTALSLSTWFPKVLLYQVWRRSSQRQFVSLRVLLHKCTASHLTNCGDHYRK